MMARRFSAGPYYFLFWYTSMMKLIRFLLFSTVFTTGASVLVIEVAAVRILSVYYGSSLFVLSSVLTVILLALSYGYYLGGKYSDKHPFCVPLYIIITFGGLSLFLLTLVTDFVLSNSATYTPFLLGPLFFSSLLFFTPALLLGIDSPYVIKLLSLRANEEERGALVGKTFFWSTAGSITGSLLSGFLLIPVFGLYQSLIGTSIILILLGLSGIIFLPKLLRRLPHYDQRNDMNVHYLILSVVIVVVVGTIVWVNSNRNSSSDIVYKDDGYYSHIEIIESTYDGKEVRLLKRDNNHSSGQFLDSDEFVFEYTKFSLLYEHLITEPKNFLMIGGGAYTIPKAIHDNYPNVAIDIIELEPSLYELAKEYFRFPESNRVTNHVGDARVFLNEIDTQYDMVFMDVFSTGHFVPPHLVTAEFFNNLKDNLTDDGVLIINFIGSQKTSTNKTITGSFTKTVMNVFPSVSVYRTYPKAIARPQNLMYIVRKNNLPTTLPNELTMDNLEDTHTFSELYIDTDKLVSNKDVVLTDNHNPAELLLLKERIFLW